MKEYKLELIGDFIISKARLACDMCGNIGYYFIRIAKENHPSTIVLCTDPKCFEYWKLKDC